MKRIFFLTSIMIVIVLFALGCQKDVPAPGSTGRSKPVVETSNTIPSSFMGVNAEILEITNELQGFVVKGLDNDSILGEKCYINCESSDIYFIYADNESEEVKELQYTDFEVGDKITVDIKGVENKYALTLRVQLLTQRK